MIAVYIALGILAILALCAGVCYLTVLGMLKWGEQIITSDSYVAPTKKRK